MKRLVLLLVVVLSVTVLLSGCKDPLNLDGFDLNLNERVDIAATFRNGNGVATIGDLHVIWDGELLPGSAPSMPVERVTVTRTRYGRQSGGHRVSFQIVNQTSSPNLYEVTGLVITSYDERGAVNATVSLDPRSATLETNAAIVYDFRL